MNTSIRDSFLRYFQPTWDRHLGWENARFVAIDCESTGTDLRTDRIVSIGAVGLIYFEIDLEDSFEAMLPIAHNTSAVTLHGITRERAEAHGVEEPVALERFLHYLRDGVVVGHHVDFDLQLLGDACQRHFGFEGLPNLSVDTMDLTLRLEAAGVLESVDGRADFSLDGLCRRFGISPHDRHTAMGDAFLTAQIFLLLLKRARRAGFLQLGQITERWVPPEERGSPQVTPR